MSDNTAALICYGIALVGVLYLLRGSRRARIAEAKAQHPATRALTASGQAGRLAARAAARVEAQQGGTVWFQCILCRNRVRLSSLTADEVIAICDDRAPTCPDCAAVLDAAEKDMAS